MRSFTNLNIIKAAFLSVSCLSCLLLFGAKTPEIIPEVKAVNTTDFLNSIGVNSAISARGERLEKTIWIINYTGIRWIRSGYEGNVSEQDYLELHKRTGIKFSYGLMSGGNDIPRLLNGGRILAKAGALLAFEGPNEPNNWGITYKGIKGGNEASWLAVAQLQSDLYKAVKNDKLLQSYPVWDLCENGAQTDNLGLQFLKIPQGANTKMADGTIYADFANCHNYFLHSSNSTLYDNQTWNAADPGPACKVDGLYGNYGTTWRSKFKGFSEQDMINLPKVTTETGMTIDGSRNEEKQARLYLNLYLAQFKRGWSYTSIYLLRDRSDEDGNQSFGFYAKDYTPRKAAVYLHNFTTILADKGHVKSPGTLAYNIPGQPETVHHLLLRNSKGKFQLAVWGEKVSGTDEISINLGKKAASINIFDPTMGITAVSTLHNANSVKLSLSDHPVVIEL